jgi:N-dimethylarginine dimethylaminohydrolase
MTLQHQATHGGPGWRPRQHTHREDVETGFIWRSCGSCSEVNDLLEVTLAWPESFALTEHDPNDFLMFEWPDVHMLQSQAEAVARFYESVGIVVHWAFSPSNLPNFLFQRDLFFMTPEGAVLARPGSEQRASEARTAASVLSELGIPILATPRGSAIFEGADALWLDATTVLIGIGLRTNQAGADLVTHVLREMGVTCIAVTLPPGVQHLLGVINLADHDLAAIRADKASDELQSILHCMHIETISCLPGEEICERRAMNFVTIAPRRVVMSAECPLLKKELSAAGIIVHELEISEYRKAAGGLGCLTGILRRRCVPSINSGNAEVG